MHTLTVPLPDPSALTYLERQTLRQQAADAWRAETGSGEDCGVDVVVEGE